MKKLLVVALISMTGLQAVTGPDSPELQRAGGQFESKIKGKYKVDRLYFIGDKPYPTQQEAWKAANYTPPSAIKSNAVSRSSSPAGYEDYSCTKRGGADPITYCTKVTFSFD